MDAHEWLAERFEANRTHLRAVAFRMLGSLPESEDAVQEAWLRLSRADTRDVENLGGWLTTVVARVCLEVLRARRLRREEPLDAGLPEPEDRSHFGAAIGLCGEDQERQEERLYGRISSKRAG